MAHTVSEGYPRPIGPDMGDNRYAVRSKQNETR